MPPTVRGLPIVKPPYSRVTAIDLKGGTLLWTIPNGDTPAAIRDHPALAGLLIPPTGAISRPALLVTKTALFVAEGPGGRPILHVIDKATGSEVAGIEVPGPIQSVPITYAVEGRQFIVFWVRAGDARSAPELVALALKKT
jgi:quinoprotein glucose dehydrogenase